MDAERLSPHPLKRRQPARRDHRQRHRLDASLKAHLVMPVVRSRWACQTHHVKASDHILSQPPLVEVAVE